MTGKATGDRGGARRARRPAHRRDGRRPLALRPARRRRQRRRRASRGGPTAPPAASAGLGARAGAGRRAGARRSAPGQARPPLRRSGVGDELAVPPRAAEPTSRSGETVDGLISDADARLARRAPGALRRRQRRSTRSRRRTSRGRTRPCIKASVDEGGAEPRARRAPLRRATSRACPSTVDTSRFAVGENLALTPGLGRAAHRGLRAHPVRAADRRRSARCRCCSRPPTINKFYVLDLAPGRSMVEWLVQPGPAGVRDLLAQPGRRAGPLRPRHLRRRGARGARRGRGDHPPAGGPPQRRLLGRDHRRGRARPPRRRGPARRGREPDA